MIVTWMGSTTSVDYCKSTYHPERIQLFVYDVERDQKVRDAGPVLDDIFDVLLRASASEQEPMDIRVRDSPQSVIERGCWKCRVNAPPVSPQMRGLTSYGVWMGWMPPGHHLLVSGMPCGQQLGCHMGIALGIALASVTCAWEAAMWAAIMIEHAWHKGLPQG